MPSPLRNPVALAASVLSALAVFCLALEATASETMPCSDSAASVSPDQTDGGDVAYHDGGSTSQPPREVSLASLEDPKRLPKCDSETAAAIKKAVAGAYKPLFYDNNFDYLGDPCYCDWHLGEHLKHLTFTDRITVDVGGQYRARLMDERHSRGLGLTGVSDDYLLHRTRLYANAEVGQRLRAYAEYIDAESNYEDTPSRPIDVNRSDMLNLFGDLMLYDGHGGPVWARAGRQELLYGEERLVSPLDWANTRRTFEGYKVFWKGSKWAVDCFYTRPVFPSPRNFDSPDYDQEFMGFWAANKGCQHRTIDLFYLVYNNGDVGFKYDTVGGRWRSEHGDWLCEFEGAVQFGKNSDDSDHSAGFWVAGLGRKLPCLPWQATLWAYYDWASGTNDLAAGHGYDQLFPLSHKYLGFMDLYGRRNIESPNLQLSLKPCDKIRVLLWYYYFFLQNSNDTPYSVVMTPYNPNNAPASADLGHEIDFTVTYAVTPRASVLVGYSHFFAGQYYKLTPGVPFRDDADFCYTQFQVNF